MKKKEESKTVSKRKATKTLTIQDKKKDVAKKNLNNKSEKQWQVKANNVSIFQYTTEYKKKNGEMLKRKKKWKMRLNGRNVWGQALIRNNQKYENKKRNKEEILNQKINYCESNERLQGRYKYVNLCSESTRHI